MRVQAATCAAPVYRVCAEWQEGVWSVEVEGVAAARAASLDDVAAKVDEFTGRPHRHRAGPSAVSMELRLRSSVRARLDLAQWYEREAATTGSGPYQGAIAAMARTARCGAARELLALGVDVRDISIVLGVSVDETCELVA